MGVTDGEFDHREDWGPLYTVVFKTEEIAQVKGNDRVLLDVHEDWLEPLT